MKAKKSFLVIALSLITMFAMVLGLVFANTKTLANADSVETDYGNRRITFDVSIYGGDNNGKSKIVSAGDTVIVTYKIAESTGVDELQLALGYSTAAFTLNQIDAYKNTALGTATVTASQSGLGASATADSYDTYTNFGTLGAGAARIVYENVNNTYTNSESNTADILFVAYFTVNQNAGQVQAYEFTLFDVNDGLNSEGNVGHDSFSTAWKNVAPVNAAEEGTHVPVYIGIRSATAFIRGTMNLTLADNTKVYDGAAAQDSEITVTNNPAFSETNAPVISLVWFDSDHNKLATQPKNVGTYYVAAESEGNNYWNAYKGYTTDNGTTLDAGHYATYTITPKGVTVSFNNKEEQYKSFDRDTFAGYLAEPYYTISGLVGTETLTVTLTTNNIYDVLL